MSFIWPVMFVLLLLLPVLVVLYLMLQRRRRQLAASYGSLGVVRGAPAGDPGRQRHVPAVLFLSSLTLLIVAMTRPQAVVSLPRIEGTVILAFDVSGSMSAADLKPTRMEAAKAAAREFVKHQPSTVRIGVVAFSDGGFAVQAPTNDQEAILATIDRLAPQRGTSLGQGILASLNTLYPPAPPGTRVLSNLPAEPTATPTPVPQGKYASASIILLTDGENNQRPDPVGAAQAAADRGVRIYTIGIGSPGGATIHVNGFTVHTQLEEGLLKQISETTDGAYYAAQNEQDLREIYDKLALQLVVRPEKTEITSLLAGAGLLILLIGGTFSLLWFGRVP